MVSIQKRIIENHEYLYLHYSYRNEAQIQSIDVRLNQSNFPESYENLYKQIVEQRWGKDLKKIIELNQKYLTTAPPFVIEKNNQIFGIGFTYDSSKIEGLELSKYEVHNLITKSQTPANRKLDDMEETLGHMKAYERMLLYKGDIGDLLLDLHESIFIQTKPSFAGLIRDHPVRIFGSNYIPPVKSNEIEDRLQSLCEWYENRRKWMTPPLLACLFHLEFEKIHPFSDGNGRVGRLLMNYILYSHKFPMLSIESQKKTSYIQALERSSLKKECTSFMHFFFREYIRQTRMFFESSSFIK
jgi:Fic family protein